MNKALGKIDLVELLVANRICDKVNAKLFVKLFFEEIGNELAHGKNVNLSGFGNFILRDKGQRPGRNPKTGQNFTIAARRVVTFKPSLKFINKVNLSSMHRVCEEI